MKLLKKVFVRTLVTATLVGILASLPHTSVPTKAADLNLPEPRSSKLER